MPDFKDIVPYLDNPLALIGYGLCLLFVLLGAVVKAGGGKADASTRKFLYSISLLGAGVVMVVITGSFTVLAMGLASERREVGTAFFAAARADQSVTREALPLGDAKITRAQVDQAIALLQRWRADADSETGAQIDEALQDLRAGNAGAAAGLLSRRLDTLMARRAGGGATALDLQEAAAAAQALGGLAFLWDTPLAQQAYDRLVDLTPDDWIAWYQLALLEIRLGNYDDAVEAAQQVRDLGQARSDQVVVAHALGLMGVVARQRADLEQAADHAAKAVALLREAGDQRSLAVELGNLGIVRRLLGEYEAAEKLHDEALSIEKSLDDSLGIAREYGNLGALRLVMGKEHQARAEELIDLSLRFNRQAGSRVGIGMRLNQLGEFAMRRSDWDAAQIRFEEVLQIAKELDDPFGEAIVLSNLGRVYKLMADQNNGDPQLYAKAEALYRDAMDLNVRLDNPIGQSIVHARLARLYLRRNLEGDIEQAKTNLEAALAISRSRKHHRATIDYLRTYGEVLLAVGEQSAACDAWSEAIELQRTLQLGPDDEKWFVDHMQVAGCGT